MENVAMGQAGSEPDRYRIKERISKVKFEESVTIRVESAHSGHMTGLLIEDCDFKHISSCSVEDTSINVPGEEVTSVDSNVSTSNISTDANCIAPCSEKTDGESLQLLIIRE